MKTHYDNQGIFEIKVEKVNSIINSYNDKIACI